MTRKPCPRCRSRATKIVSLNTGNATCQICGHEYAYFTDDKPRSAAPSSANPSSEALAKEEATEDRPRWTIGEPIRETVWKWRVCIDDVTGREFIADIYGPSPEVCLARARAFVEAQQPFDNRSGCRPIEEATEDKPAREGE